MSTTRHSPPITRSFWPGAVSAGRIRLALRKRGIPAELQEEPLEAAAETEAERASEALAYKLRLLARETDPRRKREKAFRFLIGRGFSCESCRTALERADFDPEE